MSYALLDASLVYRACSKAIETKAYVPIDQERLERLADLASYARRKEDATIFVSADDFSLISVYIQSS